MLQTLYEADFVSLPTHITRSAPLSGEESSRPETDHPDNTTVVTDPFRVRVRPGPARSLLHVPGWHARSIDSGIPTVARLCTPGCSRTRSASRPAGNPLAVALDARGSCRDLSRMFGGASGHTVEADPRREVQSSNQSSYTTHPVWDCGGRFGRGDVRDRPSGTLQCGLAPGPLLPPSSTRRRHQ